MNKIKKALYENQPPADRGRLTNSRQRKVMGGLAAGATVVSLLAGAAIDRGAQRVVKEDRVEATAAAKASPAAQLAKVLQSAENGHTIYAARGEYAFVDKDNSKITETVYDPIVFTTSVRVGNEDRTTWHVAYFNATTKPILEGSVSELIEGHQLEIQTLAKSLGGHELIPIATNGEDKLVELDSSGARTDILAATTFFDTEQLS